jgi:hypothetical protein
MSGGYLRSRCGAALGGAIAAIVMIVVVVTGPVAVAAVSMDPGTASVLADDVGFDHYCSADCAVDLTRCYRLETRRVDCVTIFETGDDHQYFVIATKLAGNSLYFGDYRVKGHVDDGLAAA